MSAKNLCSCSSDVCFIDEKRLKFTENYTKDPVVLASFCSPPSPHSSWLGLHVDEDDFSSQMAELREPQPGPRSLCGSGLTRYPRAPTVVAASGSFVSTVTHFDKSEARGGRTMPGVTVKDMNQQEFIRALAAFLKKSGKLKVPEWVDTVKLAKNKELLPMMKTGSTHKLLPQHGAWTSGAVLGSAP
ncbi:hypothetical protein GH733_000885 [Mirounga leonina]|nr:hypothetical protein GH733_000885 [Mirounga leonina]